MIENNRGSIFQLPIILMGLFIVVTFLAALLPAFVEVLNAAQQSDSLNCVGYNMTTNPALSYNASKPSSTISCLAIKLYIPYIVLGVLIAAVAGLFGQQVSYGMGGGGGGGGQYY
jgi:hypothetical protein